MHRWLPSLAFALICAAPAAAEDLPARKPGLWELKMAFEGGNLPAQTAEHCIDAETDKLMSATGGSVVQEMCSKPDIQKTGDTITVDAVTGTLTLHVPHDEFAARTPTGRAPSVSESIGTGRELFASMRAAVGPADQGASVFPAYAAS